MNGALGHDSALYRCTRPRDILGNEMNFRNHNPGAGLIA